jgi:hypothetical protein
MVSHRFSPSQRAASFRQRLTRMLRDPEADLLNVPQRAMTIVKIAGVQYLDTGLVITVERSDRVGASSGSRIVRGVKPHAQMIQLDRRGGRAMPISCL